MFLSTVFVLMRRKTVTAGVRKGLYLAAAAVFGILLGADPSPMGTVKDAIALYGYKGVIFPPRMIALSVFLLLVLIANKFICSWGCQLGTLQDLLFRLNRDKGDRKGIMRQYRPPFDGHGCDSDPGQDRAGLLRLPHLHRGLPRRLDPPGRRQAHAAARGEILPRGSQEMTIPDLPVSERIDRAVRSAYSFCEDAAGAPRDAP